MYKCVERVMIRRHLAEEESLKSVHTLGRQCSRKYIQYPKKYVLCCISAFGG